MQDKYPKLPKNFTLIGWYFRGDHNDFIGLAKDRDTLGMFYWDGVTPHYEKMDLAIDADNLDEEKN